MSVGHGMRCPQCGSPCDICEKRAKNDSSLRECDHGLCSKCFDFAVIDRAKKAEAEVARLQAQVTAVRASVKAMAYFERHWEACDNITTALGDTKAYGA